VKTLFLTSEGSSHQQLVREILENYSEVITHHGAFTTSFVKDNSISAILSDRNGFIITREIIDSVEGRVYNTHPSMLPLHRGWQPVFFSVLENTAVGVTIHQVNTGLDKGRIVSQDSIEVSDQDNLKTLHTKCRLKIMELLIHNWPMMLEGTANLTEQEIGGCYHDKREFESYFSQLKNHWSSSPSEVRALRRE